MRVLVTGATSLLGRTVAEQLNDRGEDVSVFQRRPSGLDVVEYLGDIADSDAVANAVAGAEAVVHVAGRVAMTGRWSLFEETNIIGTQNVVDAARTAGVKRMVQVSSPSVAHGGGSLVGVPAAPASPTTARGDYARSKAQAELIALAANSAELSVVAIRPHLVWGPRDTQLVGRAVSRAREGRLAIVGTGAALVDTTYIDNAADALVAALDRAPSIGGRALVVTNGQPRPVRELLNRFVMAAGLEPPRIRVPFQAARIGGRVAEEVWNRWGRDDDPPMTSFAAEQLASAHWFDQREAREALRWEPRVSLAEGFARLAAWYGRSS